MLLDWFGHRAGRDELVRAARLLDERVDAVLADPATRTRDLGGSLGTAEFTDALLARLPH